MRVIHHGENARCFRERSSSPALALVPGNLIRFPYRSFLSCRLLKTNLPVLFPFPICPCIVVFSHPPPLLFCSESLATHSFDVPCVHITTSLLAALSVVERTGVSSSEVRAFRRRHAELLVRNCSMQIDRHVRRERKHPRNVETVSAKIYSLVVFARLRTAVFIIDDEVYFSDNNA